MKLLINILIVLISIPLYSANDHTPSLKYIKPGVVIVKLTGSDVHQNIIAAPVIEQFSIRGWQPILRNFPALKKTAFNPLQYIYEVRYESDASPFSVARELEKIKDVIYAEPKYIHFTDQEILVPNDSLYSQQSHYNAIYATEAWNIQRGEDGNAIIAVIDGGTEIFHEDLFENIWINSEEIAADSIDNDGNGWVDDVYGWNFANQSGDPTGLEATLQNASHGTHTGGIISAVSDNNRGVAGASWNAQLMAVNVGSPTENTLLYGYEGILYALQNGAEIISCSWSRGGSPSYFEQEVINTVAETGAVIVASAGNLNNELKRFPACYDNVIAVAALDNSGFKVSTSNYGFNVDLAAPGYQILSTVSDNAYDRKSGTSMACPLVSGAIGLVLTQHPDWYGRQAAEQVRITADNIDSLNPAYSGKLGSGRLNMVRALRDSFPSIRITDVQVYETNGNDIIEPGETVNIYPSVINYLYPAENITLNLSVEDPYAMITTGNLNITSIGMMEEEQLSSAFEIVVDEQAPSGHRIQFRVDLQSGPYRDRDYFDLVVLPTSATTQAGNINMTVTNVGRIGDSESGSTGFSYKDGPELLFEGAVIAGTAANQISNAARSMQGSWDADFVVAPGGEIQIISPGVFSSEEIVGAYEDSRATNPMNIRIIQETYNSDQQAYDDFVIIRFVVENKNQLIINNFHLGLFFDWDLDGSSYLTNRVDYDSVRQMGYVYDTGSGPGTYVGMLNLSDTGHSFRAIYNDHNHVNNPSWGLFDGFLDSEKWEAISGGTELSSAGPADISCVIGSGPYTVYPSIPKSIAFALVAGDNYSELQMHADSALSFWQEIRLADIKSPEEPQLPFRYQLKSNFPNPFNPSTVISYQIPLRQKVVISLYNTLGQRIMNLINEVQAAGDHQVKWNGRDQNGNVMPAGIYFYQLRSGSFVSTRKMLLLK